MKAVLLSAGFGTRLRPITDNLPKCLVPIQGKPLLAYWLDLLLANVPPHVIPITPHVIPITPHVIPSASEGSPDAGTRPDSGNPSSQAPRDDVPGELLANGISEILINTHYLSSQVIDFVERSPWRSRIQLVHEPVLLGTAGTVHHNRAWLADGPFLLAHADNLTRFDVCAFMTAHAQRPLGVEITMMTFETDVPESCGIVELNAEGIVVGFHEKSPIFRGTHANAAVYIVEPSVLAFLESLHQEVIDLSTEVIPHYVGRMQTYHNAAYHRDIGTVESLACAEREFS